MHEKIKWIIWCTRSLHFIYEKVHQLYAIKNFDVEFSITDFLFQNQWWSMHQKLLISPVRKINTLTKVSYRSKNTFITKWGRQMYFTYPGILLYEILFWVHMIWKMKSCMQVFKNEIKITSEYSVRISIYLIVSRWLHYFNKNADILKFSSKSRKFHAF